MTEVIECRDLGKNLNEPTASEKLTSSDDVDYTDYRFEAARLNSFLNWPASFVDPKKLASAGFYYTGEGDKVRCFECRADMCHWTEGDDPMVDHQRWSGKCRFIRNIPCGNVPIGVDPSTIPPAKQEIHDSCGLYGIHCRPNSSPDVKVFFTNSKSPSAIRLDQLTAVKYPEYASYESRLRSFKSWPKTVSQTKEQLASAGFYYIGKDDQTVCYFCGGGLKGWDPKDEPTREHMKWFPKCKYIAKIVEEEKPLNKNTDVSSPVEGVSL